MRIFPEKETGSAMGLSFGRVDAGKRRIDSANLHVCARARARSADTCVHTRRLASSCARRRAAFEPRSRPFVVYPDGVDVIPIYSVPSPPLLLLLLGIRTPDRPARHLSSASQPRADIVRDICALRLSDCQLSCAVSSQSDRVDFICVCEPRAETFALYPESTGPDRISFWLRISTLRTRQDVVLGAFRRTFVQS